MASCSATETTDKYVSNDNFKLHTHDFYEIYIFMEGDACHLVEGSEYQLAPFDMILLRPDELHRVKHKSQGRYRRTVMSVTENFFKEEGCEKYRELFWRRKCGQNNKIEGKICFASGISDCVDRIKKYSDGYKNFSEPSVRSCFVELLYLIDRASEFSESADKKGKVGEIIEFINDSFKEPLSLTVVAEKFYMSKAYLGRIFKKATGFTVGEYITRKRIMETEKLCRQGEDISNACIDSGFSDYSSFYRAYVKERGASPRACIRAQGALNAELKE